jgi:putative hydrolase of HD superfamily
MNLIDMCLQALLYERDRRYDPHGEAAAFPDYEHLDEFFATARPRFTTETGKTVYQLVQSRYQKLRVV